MSPIGDAYLANGVVNVRVDRPLGDVENFADLPGGLAAGNPLEYRDLARGKGIRTLERRLRD